MLNIFPYFCNKHFDMANKCALVFGASGFIGNYLLSGLLASDVYDTVIIVVRKALAIDHPKLTQYIGDLESLESLKHLLMADDVFCSVGTTKKKTPNRVTYYQIDHDLPVTAAKIARENGAKAFVLVSAVGANPRSSIFYVKTKGETERDIIHLNYESTHIFRPAALMGDRKEFRLFEKLGVWLSRTISPLLMGSWRKFKPINGRVVASAMISAAQSPTKGVHYYYWDKITLLS